MELRLVCETEEADFWVVLVHASADVKERQQQREFLKTRKQLWGSKWVLGVT